MSGSINKVILVGRLGAEPRVSNTSAGAKIVNLSLATSESWKDRLSGERKSRTEWHRVVIFNPALAEIADKYLRKGSKIYVEGQLQTRKWEDQSGVEKYSTEIVLQNFNGVLVMLDGKDGDSDFGASSDSDVFSSGSSSAGGWSKDVASPDLDDDIPF